MTEYSLEPMTSEQWDAITAQMEAYWPHSGWGEDVDMLDMWFQKLRGYPAVLVWTAIHEKIAEDFPPSLGYVWSRTNQLYAPFRDLSEEAES